MRKKSWMILIVLISFSSSVYCQSEKFKALFMYNFTKYLEWPPEKKSGDFIIGVYGNSPIIVELEQISQKKRVGSQKIVVKKISDATELLNCNIVYVPENRSSKFTEVKDNCSGKGVVFITDKPGLGSSSGINYVLVNGKQNFEISKGNLDAQGIKVNSALLSLGIVVE